MIKAGQFLSSRLDILPPEITGELEGLQDEVAKESFEDIIIQIEAALGMPLETAYQSFDPEPLAAASLGQAHLATLSPRLRALTGFEKVVVKVLRPGIEQIVDVDLRALRKIAVWLSKVKLISKRANTLALVEEFAATSNDEINYLQEAVNLERFRDCFEGDPRVGTPEIIWERTSRKVLTLSDVTAIKITDVASLDKAGIDPNKVAAELARITFEQFFIHGFFHADPHPGNIFVTPIKKSNSADFSLEQSFKLTFIDFGMMGEISSAQKAKLQSFIIAVVARDARAWISATEELGVLLPTADIVQLEVAIAELFRRFGGVGVAELTHTDPQEIREFASRFTELVVSLPFQLPENYLLLIRSISVISGVTSALNRDFNMWDSVEPFARSLLRGGANSTIQKLASDGLKLATTILNLPARLESLAARVERGELRSRNPELEDRVRRLDGSIRRIATAAIFVALLVSGVTLRQSADPLGDWMIGLSVLPLIYSLGFFRFR